MALINTEDISSVVIVQVHILYFFFFFNFICPLCKFVVCFVAPSPTGFEMYYLYSISYSNTNLLIFLFLRQFFSIFFNSASKADLNSV